MTFRTKRVYLPPEADDGHRVLVDRLWPRGLSKDAAEVDLWLKDIAPSTELRRWFDHDSERWEAFQARYGKELESPERVAAFRTLQKAGGRSSGVTLLFGAKEERYNHAVMLCALLQDQSE